MYPRGAFLTLLALFFIHWTLAEAAWKTLSKDAPVVVANGGTSGLYPDQTVLAYLDTLNYTTPAVILACDLQMIMFGDISTGICRTGLNLKDSTNINLVYPEKNSTRLIEGRNVTGWFALDVTFEELKMNVSARQRSNARTAIFDGLLLEVLAPEDLGAAPKWLNSESTSFFEENGMNITDYILFCIENPDAYAVKFLSATDVGLLKKIQPSAEKFGTKVIFKFLNQTFIEPTTKQSYGELLANLSDIATFASGILVPKSYIWPINPDTQYLSSHTSLVDDAHKLNLEVYTYDFFNDEYPNAYNYSFDPIVEIMHYIEKYNFSVDGLFSDFPTTATEAIACYASSSLTSSKPPEADTVNRTLISHNGNSGEYPGCTVPAYTSAISAGVEYIDCPVQITKDGVLICRESPDLVVSTTVGDTPLFQDNLKTYPELDSGGGVYSFDLTWEEIKQQLKSNIFSPDATLYSIVRDKGHDGLYDIITLADFLALAKNNSVGALINIQNAVTIRETKQLAVVDAVVETLTAAGYTSSDKVMLESEDSSALLRLRELNVTYPLMYRIAYSSNNPISVTNDTFVDIKKYATAVSIPRRFIEITDSVGLLSEPSDVVEWAHAQNLTVYFTFLRYESTIFPWDLVLDPTVEMLFLIKTYNVDGFITDFPATTARYFENHCSAKGFNNLNFTIPLVVPGRLSATLPGGDTPQEEPAPALVVDEPPLKGVAAVSPAPAPAPVPAAAFHLSTCLVFSTTLSVILHILAVL